MELKTKNRTIYVFETKLYSLVSHETNDKEENILEVNWKPDIIEKIFNHIINLDKKERVQIKEGEWFFSLENMKIDKKEIPGDEDCLYGWFEGVRLGLRTDLKSLSTLTTRENPKKPDESETQRTYFYFRLKDGLFLLDTYSGNVVTVRRLENYLEEKAQPIFKKYNIRNIVFHHRINKGFLEELDKFDVIRLAKVRIKIQDKNEYDTKDAIGYLKEISRRTYANYLDIVVGRRKAKKRGLIIPNLKEFLQKLLENRQEIVSGIIEGSRSDGGPKTLKLDGIEEKHKEKFLVDEKGEVLPEHMFEFMIEMGNKKE